MNIFTLTLDFPGQRLDLDLRSPLWDLFDHGANMLEVADNGDLTVTPDFFAQPVKDKYRYLLKWTPGEEGEKDWWALCARDGTPNPEFSDNLDADIDFGHPRPKIVLLLESPHRDEFDQLFNPRGPAKGTTGRGIHYYLASHVLPLLKHFGLELDAYEEYAVYIVNPVQYQTSLDKLLKPRSPAKLRSELKSAVWWKLWGCCKEEFARRMQDYDPEIVLNGCTDEFKDTVGEVIRNLGQVQHFNVSHPAPWQPALSPFGKA